MRRAPLAVSLTVVFASMLSAQASVLRTFAVTEGDAYDAVLSTLGGGSITLVGQRRVFTAAPPEARAALAREAIAFLRTLTGSAEFGQRYAAYRASQRPAPPALPRTGDEARAEQQRQIALAVKQAQDRAASLPPDARNRLEAEIEVMRRQVDELHADPEYRAAVDAAVREAAAAADREHSERLRAFDERLPASARVVIARHLQRFLEVCANVAYDARLREDADGARRFIDPALESQSPEWKLCYRAGKPAVDAARTAAAEWLKVLVH
jgi:hypothetical protein